MSIYQFCCHNYGPNGRKLATVGAMSDPQDFNQDRDFQMILNEWMEDLVLELNTRCIKVHHADKRFHKRIELMVSWKRCSEEEGNGDKKQ